MLATKHFAHGWVSRQKLFKRGLGFFAILEIIIQRVIDSLEAMLVVVDLDGTILKVNEAWSRFAENAKVPETENKNSCGVGCDYFSIHSKVSPGPKHAEEVFDGLRKVQRGNRL